MINEKDNKKAANNSTKEKGEFYFTVHSFMTHELGLSGAALIVYAIIYAFSADGKGTFYGTVDFIEEYGAMGRTSVKSALKNLLDKGLITVKCGDKFEHKHYVVNHEILQSLKKRNQDETLGSRILNGEESDSDREGSDFDRRGSDFDRKGSDFDRRGSDFDPNNKYNNKYNNKLIFNSYSSADAQSCALAEREKEKNDFKKDFDFSGTATDEARAYLSSFAKSDESNIEPYSNNESKNHTSAYASHTTVTSANYSPKNSNHRQHRKNDAHGCRYVDFNPEEAFRLALERTEELFRELNERENQDE